MNELRNAAGYEKAWISPREPQAHPRLVIAGTGSGSGKTTVTLGLMRAFARQGLNVQGFKCGPDYIDPAYHTAVTGHPSRNLDSWMTSSDYLQEYFLQASADADLSVIEGVMGLYDGKEDTALTGSTAEIAILTASPVLLVVDVRSMGRSAAAIVLGFRQLEPQVQIAAVLVNRCGSEGHYRLVKAAIEAACGIPVIGWLPATAGWTSRAASGPAARCGARGACALVRACRRYAGARHGSGTAAGACGCRSCCAGAACVAGARSLACLQADAGPASPLPYICG